MSSRAHDHGGTCSQLTRWWSGPSVAMLCCTETVMCLCKHRQPSVCQIVLPFTLGSTS